MSPQNCLFVITLLVHISLGSCGKAKILSPTTQDVTAADVHGIVFEADAELEDINTAASQLSEALKSQTPETGLDPTYQLYNDLVLTSVTHLIDKLKRIEEMTETSFNEKTVSKIEKCFRKVRDESLNAKQLFDDTLSCRKDAVTTLKSNIAPIVNAIKEGYDILTDAPVKIRDCHPKSEPNSDDEYQDDVAERLRERRALPRYVKKSKEGSATVYVYGKFIDGRQYKIVNSIKRGAESEIKLIEVGHATSSDLHVGNSYQKKKTYGCSTRTKLSITPIGSDTIEALLRRMQNVKSFTKQARTKIRSCMNKGALSNCKLVVKPEGKSLKLDEFNIKKSY